jgi:Domain of unknown function (DUF5668)
MNNSNRNYISAAILIVLGVLFLGKEFNLFNIHWGDLFRFWPLLLIGLGLNMLLGGKSGGSSTSIIILICLLAIPFSIVRSCKNDINDGFRNGWDHHRSWSDNGDIDSDENDNDDNDDNNDNDDNDENDSYSKSQNFSEEMEPAIKTAKLNLEGGVAGIDIDGTTSKLFEADTKSTFSDFSVSKTVSDGVANINFSMKGIKGKDDDINIGGNNQKNEAKIKLNPNIEWSMIYKFGVSGADLDLSPFNVKDLNIKTGVSGVDIKIGDKANEMNVDIDAGVAGIKVKVPNAVGVRIKTDSFLSDNNFKDFTESNGYHLSPGYDKATKKITINYNGAFASFDVERY